MGNVFLCVRVSWAWDLRGGYTFLFLFWIINSKRVNVSTSAGKKGDMLSGGIWLIFGLILIGQPHTISTLKSGVRKEVRKPRLHLVPVTPKRKSVDLIHTLYICMYICMYICIYRDPNLTSAHLK